MPKLLVNELNERIAILTLEKEENEQGTIYQWKDLMRVWAKSELIPKTNLFSRVGVGAKTIKFTIRKNNLSLHNAILWQGKHCFLTDIAKLGRAGLEITAALIEPKQCTVTRKTVFKNELNRPVLVNETTLSFPGYLVEKYLGYKQDTPQAVNETTYVLVTPKPIKLEVADIVKVDEDTYNVQVVHSLDEYKNEYEITAVKDV